MGKTVHVKAYTRKAPAGKKSTGGKNRTGKAVKPSKAGTKYGPLPHQRLPRKGEL